MANLTPSLTDLEIPKVDPQCWDGCVEGTANHFKCDNLTTEKIIQKAGILFALLATVIFISALMVQYPTASTTFFSLLGLAAFASLVTMVVAGVRYCKENNIKSDDLFEIATQALPTVSTNPFDAPPSSVVSS